MAGGGAHRSSLLQPYIKCRYQNRSINACINKSCIKYAFMCDDKTCERQNDHIGCLAIISEHIKDSIRAKIVCTS